MFDGAPVFDAVIINLPCVIKSSVSKTGQRLVEVEASSEAVDEEGDVILQSALMESADSFVKTGHVDLNHYSELGDRLGLADPLSYIVGRPTEVKDLGDKRTGVIVEIRRAADGSHDPIKNRFDAFWDSLQTKPPVRWRSSIFGYPTEGGSIDCSKDACGYGATRFLVKGISWKSLAFTTSPVNTDLKGHAKIVSAKSFVAALIKSQRDGKSFLPAGVVAGPVVSAQSGDPGMPYSASTGPNHVQIPHMMPPFNVDELVGQYHNHMKEACHHCSGIKSYEGFKAHFAGCCGADEDRASMLAHALMHICLNEEAKASIFGP